MKALLLFLVTLYIVPLQAQTAKRNLSRKLTLHPSSYESGNGASVVWHPVLKKYITARAGNISYPMDVFDANGVKQNEEKIETGFDIRGMWYDTKRKRLMVNGYSTSGWGWFSISKKGLPDSVHVLFEGMNQPDEQIAGCYNPLRDQVLFLYGFQVVAYHPERGEPLGETAIVDLTKGISQVLQVDFNGDYSEFPDDLNSTMAFTGIPGKEIAILNKTDQCIHLFSIKTGLPTQLLQLPKDAKPQGFLCFAYANGYYFLYDKDEKNWIGYK